MEYRLEAEADEKVASIANEDDRSEQAVSRSCERALRLSQKERELALR